MLGQMIRAVAEVPRARRPRRTRDVPAERLVALVTAPRRILGHAADCIGLALACFLNFSRPVSQQPRPHSCLRGPAPRRSATATRTELPPAHAPRACGTR